MSQFFQNCPNILKIEGQDRRCSITSVDGTVENTMVEMKCPYSGKELAPDVANALKSLRFWKMGKNEINLKHQYH